jgi:hypothetical protein
MNTVMNTPGVAPETLVEAAVVSSDLQQRNVSSDIVMNPWSNDWSSWQLTGSIDLVVSETNTTGTLGLDRTSLRVGTFTMWDAGRWWPLVGQRMQWAASEQLVDSMAPMLYGWWSAVVNTASEDGSELPVYLTGAIAGALGANGSLPEQLSFSGAAVIPRLSVPDACDPYGWSRWDSISGYITVSSVDDDSSGTVLLRLSLALEGQRTGSSFWSPPRLEWYPRHMGSARPGATPLNISFAGALGSNPFNSGYYMQGRLQPWQQLATSTWLCDDGHMLIHAAAAA